jgi:hypothetical protein
MVWTTPERSTDRSRSLVERFDEIRNLDQHLTFAFGRVHCVHRAAALKPAYPDEHSDRAYPESLKPIDQIRTKLSRLHVFRSELALGK